jgi:2,5-furandicarboxylate decarboxylase 1
MAWNDLREYLGYLEERGELLTIDDPVSADLELSCIAREAAVACGPALLCRNVPGARLPVLTNLFAHRGRVAAALGVTLEEMPDRWLHALEHQVPPVVVPDGPCQEVVDRNPDAAGFIPKVVWHSGDGGPYITFGLCVTRDPDTGEKNMGIYRIHLKDGPRSGMKLQPPKHGGIACARAEAKGKPLEIAVVIGTDPALYLASQAIVPYGVDELGVAGALRGAPVELVKCVTVDLEVPATAEIVLEGRILPGVRESEGPFGEYMGYYSGASDRQVVEWTAITHRRDPIYLATYEGRPPTNTHMLQAMAREPIFLRNIRSTVCPTVKDVHVTLGGNASQHVVVSIKQQAAGQARNVALNLLQYHYVKHVTIVDDDVDVRDPMAVEWAIATRCQADRDVLIMQGMMGQHLDPSQPAHPTGLGAKMAIDATMPVGRPYDMIEFPPDMVAAARERLGTAGAAAQPAVPYAVPVG